MTFSKLRDALIEEHLKKPYGRVVFPEADGWFRAEIIEFPGCIAVGNSAAEALENLEEVAIDWLGVLIDKGQHVPEPIESSAEAEIRLILARIEAKLDRIDQIVDRVERHKFEDDK